MPVQRDVQFRIGALLHCGAAHHHEIEPATARNLLAKVLAHQALDAIAIHGPAQLFPGDSQAEAGPSPLSATRPCENGEESVGRLQRPVEDTPKVRRAEKTPLPGESVRQGGNRPEPSGFRLPGARDRIREPGGRAPWRDGR